MTLSMTPLHILRLAHTRFALLPHWHEVDIRSLADAATDQRAFRGFCVDPADFRHRAFCAHPQTALSWPLQE
ncbi:hypothetical protein ABIE58_001632 [Roseovarius sp. MBR-78]|jgi:hypothetical protein|uniref:hypothetical protein n=1 Tax=Roseovarius sp. MBR-78 TaxID=3156460 RepID=UPI0033935624